jgi:hypothetical protein
MPMVFNPTKVRFTPSPDHDATIVDGSAAVTTYRLDISGTGAPPATDLGKPPNAPAVEVPLPPRSAFSGNGPFIPQIVTLGPGGASPSPAGSPFGFADAPRPATDVVAVV